LKDLLILLAILGGPSLLGIILGMYFPKKIWGYAVSGLLPWLTLLCILLYQEYFVPYSGGGFSFWPIAQVTLGTVLAFLGILSYSITGYFKKRSRPA
jgi:hypothetical protein